MKSYINSTKANTSRYILTKPFKVSDFNFEHLEDYDEDTEESAWREKARRMQARRWRKIKHQLV